jgi:hypothetical protein
VEYVYNSGAILWSLWKEGKEKENDRASTIS